MTLETQTIKRLRKLISLCKLNNSVVTVIKSPQTRDADKKETRHEGVVRDF